VLIILHEGVEDILHGILHLVQHLLQRDNPITIKKTSAEMCSCADGKHSAGTAPKGNRQKQIDGKMDWAIARLNQKWFLEC